MEVEVSISNLWFFRGREWGDHSIEWGRYEARQNCVTCQGKVRSLEYNHNIIWIFPHFWDYINYIMTTCNKGKVDWSSEVRFLLSRNWNSWDNLSPSLNLKSGSILQLNSENRVITVQRFSAGKSGSTSLTPRPTKRNGRNGSSVTSMIPTNKLELGGASYRRNSTGKPSLHSGPRTASRTGSMAPSGTTSVSFLVTSTPAEHAIISKLAS